MLTKHGHKSLGKCRRCGSDVFKKDDQKCICPKCGEIKTNEINLNIYPQTGGVK